MPSTQFGKRRITPRVSSTPLVGQQLPRHLLDNIAGGTGDNPYFDNADDCLAFLKSSMTVDGGFGFFMHGGLRSTVEEYHHKHGKHFTLVFHFIGLDTDYRTPMYRVYVNRYSETH